eukprot:6473923-Amphidinium_carterae.1
MVTFCVNCTHALHVVKEKFGGADTSMTTFHTCQDNGMRASKVKHAIHNGQYALDERHIRPVL